MTRIEFCAWLKGFLEASKYVADSDRTRILFELDNIAPDSSAASPNPISAWGHTSSLLPLPTRTSREWYDYTVGKEEG